MRWLVLLSFSLLFSGIVAHAQPAPQEPTRPITKLPKPTAQPEFNPGYAPPSPVQEEGPSDADVGPVQKRFVRASKTDDLALTQVQDNASQDKHEKRAIDKRVTVPLVHDVQNDHSYNAKDNHALDFEIKYLNWGAVTQKQLRARQGHYFTITVDNDGPATDLTTRFEYRQVKSKEIVRTLTQKLPKTSGAERAYFAVVDEAYLAYGPVCSWRITILKGDTIVAESKSFIW